MKEIFRAEAADSRKTYFTKRPRTAESPDRSKVGQFDQMLRERELRKIKKEIVDEAGRKLGVIEFDPQVFRLSSS